MNILVACEFSGIVREAFKSKGHNVWSCDLLPSEIPGKHLQGDVREYIDYLQWDMVLAFPPCTYLASSGIHWNKRVPGRAEKTEEAVDFFMFFVNLDTPMVMIENPVGIMSTRYRKPDQYIQPYDFGENASKRTGLWLKGLPLLQPTSYYPPRIVKGKKRWANQSDSGQSNVPETKRRWKDKSRTYKGIAEAMADQWTPIAQR